MSEKKRKPVGGLFQKKEKPEKTKPKQNDKQKNKQTKELTKQTIQQSILKKYPELKTVITSFVIAGDISALTQEQRTLYYRAYCESLKLNPLTKPFDLLEIWDKDKQRNKVVLYANKECAAQLREQHGVSIDDIHIEQTSELYMVVVKGHDKTGKTDCEIGVVPIKGLYGEKLSNAMMKATTKAKRRLSLSICGLGMLDETEVETINNETKYSTQKEQKKAKNPVNKISGNITFKDIISYINTNMKSLKARKIDTSEIVKQAKATKDPKILQTIMDMLTGNKKEQTKKSELKKEQKQPSEILGNPENLGEPGQQELYGSEFDTEVY